VLNPSNVWSRAITEAGHDSGICNHGAELDPNLQQADRFFDRLTSGPSEPPSWGYDKAYALPSTNPPRSKGWRAGVPQLTPAAGAASEVYVDFVKGVDTNDGSKASPFKTIAAAVAHSASSPAPRTIYLESSGTHYVSAPITLSSAHSGTTITSSDRDIGAVVSGGLSLHLSWTKTSSSSLINTSAIKDKSIVYQATLPTGTPRFLELFNGSTARFVPAREPDGNPELDQNNYNAHAASWLPARDFGKAQVVDNSSCPGLPADACNRGGMFPSYFMGVGGPADNFDPPHSYWAIPDPHGGGASTYTIPSGMVVGKSGGMGALRAGGKDGFVFMMHTHSWGSWVYEINETASDGTLKFGEGGFQEARGTGNPQTGGGSYYISHRPEFLDSAGEWYLDEASNTLYLAVPTGEEPPLEVFAPMVDEIFKMQGSKADPVKNGECSECSQCRQCSRSIHCLTCSDLLSSQCA
jgi:hypothetical protein